MIYRHTHTYTHTHTHVCMHACLSMYVCMYVCMCVCMHVCMCVCMCACMHVCMYVVGAVTEIWTKYLLALWPMTLPLHHQDLFCVQALKSPYCELSVRTLLVSLARYTACGLDNPSSAHRHTPHSASWLIWCGISAWTPLVIEYLLSYPLN